MAPTTPPPLGRNEPCHCGSGRKYKHCCLEKDEAAARTERTQTQEAEGDSQATATAAPAVTAQPPRSKHQTHQPWKRTTATNTHGFQRMSTPRKIGSG